MSTGASLRCCEYWCLTGASNEYPHARPIGDQEVAGSTCTGSAIFCHGDHEISSMVILSLPLIQEGQLSVSGKRMCTLLVNRL